MGAGFSILVTFSTVAVIATLSIFVFKQFINKVTDNYGMGVTIKYCIFIFFYFIIIFKLYYEKYFNLL